ncbi:hypothetical protein HKX48_004076 [Thoreauomyces humboldtii]|nr:hypothetical protein HKX48_004076 [Thoreauomyces humboldtii]
MDADDATGVSVAERSGSNVPIPVTVFTGFLGAGKTSVILNLLSRLPDGYNVVLLKNEFGDVKVDSELAKESNVQVTEMLNGCMCCVLVGQMANALTEIRETMNPSRIVIETSGSAFPAPIAWQIRQLEPQFSLDAIITVVDCINFVGYEDTSYTARIQAQYTDLILLNKWECVTERELDIVIDKVNDLNTDTAKFKCDKDTGCAPDLVFGLDSKLFELEDRSRDEGLWKGLIDPDHMDKEVTTRTIRGSKPGVSTTTAIATAVACDEDCKHDHDHTSVPSRIAKPVALSVLKTLLEPIPSDTVYRVKGFVLLLPEDSSDAEAAELHIVNWAFGRMEVTKVKRKDAPDGDEGSRDFGVLLTVMGQWGMNKWCEAIEAGLTVMENP